MDKYRQSREYNVASSDQRYNTKLSFTYALPIGKGKPFLNQNKVMRNIVGELQVSGILDYLGANPYGVGQPGYSFQPVGFNRPNRVPSVKLKSASHGAIKKWIIDGHSRPEPLMFDPAAFADTGSSYVLGNAARQYSSLRGTPIRNENLSAKKAFSVERFQFILQADFYNVFNRAVFSSTPNTNIEYTSFGRITSASVGNSNRQGQGSQRIEF